MAPLTTHKRARTTSGSNAALEPPKHKVFWVVQGADPAQPISKMNVFAIEKGFHALLGCDPKNITCLKSGDLLVEVVTGTQANALQKATKLHKTPIKVSPHKTLNTCKGIVKHPHLKVGSVEEIKEGLNSIASDVHRFTTFRDGKKVPTGTCVITFKTPKKPETVKIGYLRVPVKTFIPNPLRCFKCQKYGHGQTSCRRGTVCSNCGLPDHDDKSCQAAASKCSNCQGDHPAFSRSCPIWLKEREVQRVKVSKNLSFPEARRLVDAETQKGPTYAAKAAMAPEKKKAKATKSVATQTDLNRDTNTIQKDTRICQTEILKTSSDPALKAKNSSMSRNKKKHSKNKNQQIAISSESEEAMDVAAAGQLTSQGAPSDEQEMDTPAPHPCKSKSYTHLEQKSVYEQKKYWSIEGYYCIILKSDDLNAKLLEVEAEEEYMLKQWIEQNRNWKVDFSLYKGFKATANTIKAVHYWFNSFIKIENEDDFTESD